MSSKVAQKTEWNAKYYQLNGWAPSETYFKWNISVSKTYVSHCWHHIYDDMDSKIPDPSAVSKWRVEFFRNHSVMKHPRAWRPFQGVPEKWFSGDGAVFKWPKSAIIRGGPSLLMPQTMVRQIWFPAPTRYCEGTKTCSISMIFWILVRIDRFRRYFSSCKQKSKKIVRKRIFFRSWEKNG